MGNVVVTLHALPDLLSHRNSADTTALANLGIGHYASPSSYGLLYRRLSDSERERLGVKTSKTYPLKTIHIPDDITVAWRVVSPLNKHVL